MRKTTAFIFDVDGTMFDNMIFHLQAWEKMIAELGSSLKGPELFKQLYGKNTEVLDRIFGTERFSYEQKQSISTRKDAYFREFYGPHLRLMKGLNHFLSTSHKAGILLGIGTAGLVENIDFAFGKLKIRDLFATIITEADVQKSKPEPETFLKAAESLGVAPSEAIVFEDVPKGVEAAANAGMKAVVILTSHTAGDFAKYNNVIKVIKDYTELSPEALFTTTASMA